METDHLYGANDHCHFKGFITAEGAMDHYESWQHGFGMIVSDGLTIGKFHGRGGGSAYLASGETPGYSLVNMTHTNHKIVLTCCTWSMFRNAVWTRVRKARFVNNEERASAMVQKAFFKDEDGSLSGTHKRHGSVVGISPILDADPRCSRPAGLGMSHCQYRFEQVHMKHSVKLQGDHLVMSSNKAQNWPWAGLLNQSSSWAREQPEEPYWGHLRGGLLMRKVWLAPTSSEDPDLSFAEQEEDGQWIRGYQVTSACGGSGWRIVWSDEFSAVNASFNESKHLDATSWKIHNGCNDKAGAAKQTSPMEAGVQSCFAKQNVAATDGLVFLKATEDPSSGSYKAASISTLAKSGGAEAGQRAWKYGRWDVRAKMPKTKGLWATFRLISLDGEPETHANRSVVDFMQYRAGNNTAGMVSAGLHFGSDAENSTSRSTSQISFGCINDFSDKFYEYSVVWTPKSIGYYVDGIMYHREDMSSLPESGQAFHQRMMLNIELKVGGDVLGSKNVDPLDEASVMIIDYVRVYQSNRVSDDLTSEYPKRHQDRTYQCQDPISSKWKICKRLAIAHDDYSEANAVPLYEKVCSASSAVSKFIDNPVIGGEGECTTAGMNMLYTGTEIACCKGSRKCEERLPPSDPYFLLHRNLTRTLLPVCRATGTPCTTELCNAVVEKCTTHVQLFCTSNETKCHAYGNQKRYTVANGVFQRLYLLAENNLGCSEATGGVAKLNVAHCPSERCVMLPSGVTQSDFETWSSLGFGIPHTLDANVPSGKRRRLGGDKNREPRTLPRAHIVHKRMSKRLWELGSLNSYLQFVPRSLSQERSRSLSAKSTSDSLPAFVDSEAALSMQRSLQAGLSNSMLGSTDRGDYTAGDQKTALARAGAYMNGTLVQFDRPSPEFEFPPLYMSDPPWTNGICQEPIDIWTLALAAGRAYEFDFDELLDDTQEKEQVMMFDPIRLFHGEKMIISRRFNHDCTRFHRNQVNDLPENSALVREITRDPYKFVFDPLFIEGAFASFTDDHPGRLRVPSFRWGNSLWAFDMRVKFHQRTGAGAQRIVPVFNWGPVNLYRSSKGSTDPLYEHYNDELLLHIDVAGKSYKMKGPKLIPDIWMHLVVQCDGVGGVIFYLSPGGDGMTNKQQATYIPTRAEFNGHLSFTGQNDEPPFFLDSRTLVRNVFASGYLAADNSPQMVSDGLPATYWDSSPHSNWQSKSWLAWNLTIPTVVKRYTLMYPGVNSCPTGWTFEGSNADWTKFDPNDRSLWQVLDYHYESPECTKASILQQYNIFTEFDASQGENFVKHKYYMIRFSAAHAAASEGIRVAEAHLHTIRASPDERIPVFPSSMYTHSVGGTGKQVREMGGYHAGMVLDHFRFWSRSLTDKEVDDAWTYGVVKDTTALEVEYSFDRSEDIELVRPRGTSGDCLDTKQLIEFSSNVCRTNDGTGTIKCTSNVAEEVKVSGSGFRPSQSTADLEIDVQFDGDIHVLVTGIQGWPGVAPRQNEYVKTYRLKYLADENWHWYQAPGTSEPIELHATHDGRSFTEMLKYPFEARAVRVIPVSWNSRINIRLEAFTCASSDSYVPAGHATSFPNQTIVFDLGDEHEVRRYTVSATNDLCPESWAFEASEDGDAWVTLDEQFTSGECVNNAAQTFNSFSSAPANNDGDCCKGPYPGHPECEGKLNWVQWESPWSPWSQWYKDNGVDSTRCSAQHYLSTVEFYCPKVPAHCRKFRYYRWFFKSAKPTPSRRDPHGYKLDIDGMKLYKRALPSVFLKGTQAIHHLYLEYPASHTTPLEYPAGAGKRGTNYSYTRTDYLA